jgi:hypothetical protein
MAVLAHAQLINVVSVKQTDNRVTISYDMVGIRGAQDISILCSTNGGASFHIPVKTATGDIGQGVQPGGRKTVVWDVLKDVQALHTNEAVFKISATPMSSGNSGGSGSTGSFTMDFDGIVLKVNSIKRAGDAVKFEFKLTSTESDQEAFIHKNHIRMIDTEGNVYDNEIKISLGSATRESWVRQNLIKGVPMKGELQFDNIPKSTKEIAVLEIRINSTTQQKRQISIPQNQQNVQY